MSQGLIRCIMYWNFNKDLTVVWDICLRGKNTFLMKLVSAILYNYVFSYNKDQVTEESNSKKKDTVTQSKFSLSQSKKPSKLIIN